MKNYKRVWKPCVAVLTAAAITLTSAPGSVLAAQTQAIGQSAEPGRIEGGVDINSCGGRLEAEDMQPVAGDFNSYEVSTGEEEDGTGYVEWNKQTAWANAKWLVYFTKPGKYTVTARINVTEVEGKNFKFGFGNTTTGDGPGMYDNAIISEPTNGYEDIELCEVQVGEEGLYAVKIMDNDPNNEGPSVKAKLDYLQFDLIPGSEPTPAPGESEEDKAALEEAKKIYLDKDQTTEDRIEALLGVMTLEEKAAQMVQAEQGNGGNGTEGNRPATPALVTKKGIGSVLSGGGSAPSTGNSAEDWENRVNEFKSAALKSRLGIPIIYGVDAVHGHNNVDNAVIFPHNIGLGAAHDEKLVEEIGKAAAEEIAATGIRWTFAPTLGIPDSERWGRFYECFGEYADIVAELGTAYVKGFQAGNLVAATAKHYIGEGQTENGVNQGDVKTDDFDELIKTKELLKPYKEAIDAGAYTVMASYNSVNGKKCHANKELLDKLKDDTKDGGLGFKGFIVSDYNGVDQVDGADYNAKVANSVNAGVDMFMEPYDWENCIKALVDGVKNEKITEERINDAVSRILWVKFEMGLFEEEVGSADEKALLDKFGGEEHRAVAKEAVEKSLTVLKNDKVKGKNKTALDLLDDNGTDITVAGYKADDMGAQCGGWTISWQGGLDINNNGGNVNSSGGNRVTKGTTIWEGFKDIAGDKATYNARGNVKEGTDVVVVVAGEEPYAESNGDKAPDELTLPADDLNVIKTVLETKGDIPAVLVLTTGRPVAIADFIDGFDAVVEAWLPGTEGDAVASVMLDDDKDFTATCPVTWMWYPEYISEKADLKKADLTKILFPRDTGLKKDGTSINDGGQTSIPKDRPEAPEKPEEQEIPMYQEAIDIDANDNILEGEWCNSGSYNISTDSESVDGNRIGYAEWSKKEWGNGKWSVYFRQAGTYKVTLRMKVTEPSEGDFDNFKFCIYESGDPNPDMIIPSKGATNGYDDFVVEGLAEVPSAGKWNIKIMDSSKQVSAKLDYMKFELQEATGDKDEGTDSDGQDPADETPIKSNGTVVTKNGVKVWMTSTEKAQDMSWYKYPTDMANQLSEKAAIDTTTVDDQDLTTINVDQETTYQTFLGLGTSLEESSVYNLNQLEDNIRQEFIEDLVNPEKGGMTLFRITIATADFTAQRFYTYYDIDNINDIPEDFEPNWNPKEGEEGFSIQKDREYGIIDTIKMVQAAAKKFGVEDEVKFFASSWTPPGWMKNDDANKYGKNQLPGEGERLRGGTLSDDHIDDMAMYYLRFLEEYAKEGIPVYGMTLQNEPGDEFNYPSCKITGAQEGKLAIKMKELIKNSEILKEKGISDVKLWAFDHNCSIAENYVKDLITVDGAIDAIDGIAFHDYSGSMDIMQQIYDKYLNKGDNKEQTVNLTERSVWGTTGANSIITYLRNNAISYNSWVTMLDSNVGIHQWPGTPDPTMFARAAGSSTDYWAMPEFYISGQFSRFIRPGYVRVKSDEGSTSTIRNVVFKNPETGDLVAVVVNASKKKQNFKFVCGDVQFIGAAPAGNIVTYVWNPAKKAENPGNTSNPGIIGGIGNIGGIITPTEQPSTSTAPIASSTPGTSADPSASSAPGTSANPSVSGAPVVSANPSVSGAPVTSADPSVSSAPGASTDPSASSAPVTSANPSASSAPGVNTPVNTGSKVTINDVKYVVTSTDGTNTVQYSNPTNKNDDTKVVIPASVKTDGTSYKVTSIAKKAFKDNTKVTKVTIGTNVKKIGKKAFKGCKNLKTIVINSKKLTSSKVGKNAFKGINKNAVIKVPKGKVNAYKKIILAKGAPKSVKVKAK